MGNSKKDIASQVEQRAAELLPPADRPEIDRSFVKDCLDLNERGDGILFAALHRDDFLHNVTPKNGGEWYVWGDNVWVRDDFSRRIEAVEDVAIEYKINADPLENEIIEQGIDKEHPDSWKIHLLKKYKRRLTRLRSLDGANKAVKFAPIVETSMACRESDFDQQPWLLPVKNGVIDLQTGVLTAGRPDDLMRRSLNIEYDPHADYSLWEQVLRDITGSDNSIPEFIKRSFGYAMTGWSYEQYIWLFIGPGRNGKGILFNMISEVLGPFFHTINPAMLLEQRNPPSPAAASEHLFSLLGKRLIVGSETNKGKRIDMAAVKELTGEDEINCRPNFSSEITFYPSHTLMLRSNAIPYGMTSDFAMKERLLLIDFPYRFVDDVAKHQKEDPRHAEFYRKKDKHLKDKLREIKPGILRWLVEGCLEWQQDGLSPPAAVLEAVKKLSLEEDYITAFIESCLVTDDATIRLACKEMYRAFCWWWSENEGRSKRMPAMKTINKGLRERGFEVAPKSGKTWVFGCRINEKVAEDVAAFNLPV